MPAIVLVLIGLGLFYLAYRFYSKFLAEKIYKLDPDFKTPAHELRMESSMCPPTNTSSWGTTLSLLQAPRPS